MRVFFLVTCVYVFVGLHFAHGDSFTTGPKGIDSRATGLDGTGILIGQVENQRSGKSNYDNAANSASNTVPAGVYFQGQGGQAPPNFGIDDHATLR